MNLCGMPVMSLDDRRTGDTIELSGMVTSGR